MRTRAFVCLTVWILAACSCGGSEKTSAPPADRLAPDVRLLFPCSLEPELVIVRESTDVYVAARDSSSGGSPGPIAKVEFYFVPSDTTGPTRFGEVAAPISLEAIPDSSLRSLIDLPAGWSLYTKRWFTGWKPWPRVGMPVNTGTRARLFAVATDLAGNRGRSEEMPLVLVINAGDSDPVPDVIFMVYPQSGRVGQEFVFDPRYTTDHISTPEEIRIRWDFGDHAGNRWDIDWDADARADEIVRHTYSSAGRYGVRMQVRFRYFHPDSISSGYRQIIVTP